MLDKIEIRLVKKSLIYEMLSLFSRYIGANQHKVAFEIEGVFFAKHFSLMHQSDFILK